MYLEIPHVLQCYEYDTTSTVYYDTVLVAPVRYAHWAHYTQIHFHRSQFAALTDYFYAIKYSLCLVGVVENLRQIINLELSMDNAPGGLKQREVLLHVLGLKQLVNLVACDDSLSTLSIEQLLLHVLDGLSGAALLSKCSADLEVSASGA